jgi:hypothetical protein
MDILHPIEPLSTTHYPTYSYWFSSIVSVNGTTLKTLLLNYTVDETPKHFMFSGMGSDGFCTMLPTA